MPRVKYILFCLLLLFVSNQLFGQSNTIAEGIVVDGLTGEPLPSVQVYFTGTTIGTISNLDGKFHIDNNKGLNSLTFQSLGYKTQVIYLKGNQPNLNLKIKLYLDILGLQEVIVMPSRLGLKDRYRYVDNPAVELVHKVIDNKGANIIKSADCYKTKRYEKLVLAVDRFDVDFDNIFWRDVKFLKKYIDTSQFNDTPTLTVSLREVLAEDDFMKNPHQEHEYIIANRFQGIIDVFDKDGLTTTIDAIFTKVNIFDNDIEILDNRFVSPLSSRLAESFYHYYIMDTIDLEGDRCIDLAFAPINAESFGFMGHLYIMNDSTYALKKYSISVPPHINLNFVSDLAIEQSFFQLPEGLWASDNTNVYVRFYLFKNLNQIYAHHNIHHYDYKIGELLPDTLLVNMNANKTVSDSARIYDHQWWNAKRPIKLTSKEAVIDSLLPELRRVPKIDASIRIGEVVFSGYLATNENRQKSKFDFGSIYNTISYNDLEGVRFRLGGMTTTNLHPKWFMNGYLAFGCKDLRLKYNVTLIHSFNEKEYHPYEPLHHAVFLSSYYDVEVPGQTYSYLDRDNVFMSFSMYNSTQKMQYVQRTKLRYEKEWPNRFGLNIWAQHEKKEAASALQYERINADSSISNVKHYDDFQCGLSLRYTPGKPLYYNRVGQESPFNLSKDAPIFSLSHTIGYIDNRFFYNCTDFYAEKRFWLSAFGHIDATMQMGILWNQVPYTKLYIPQSNQSFFMTPKAFSLMQPMEFVMDRYIALFSTYHLKGWIFNRIPLINKLKLREVTSFSMVYGTLSQQNNPNLLQEGLYVLPEGCSAIGKTPYMEMSLGVENIFRFIRIDWVHRLSYTEGLSKKEKNGVRLSFRVAF